MIFLELTDERKEPIERSLHWEKRLIQADLLAYGTWK
jgi:hypothetical protein